MESPADCGATFAKGFAPGESSPHGGTHAYAKEGTSTSAQARTAVNIYLLDTNVVSELRKAKPHGSILQWIQGVAESDLHISAVTVSEIQAGIELTRQQDTAKADEIKAWLDLISSTLNIIPMDAAAFRLWARLMHRASNTLY